MLELQNLTIELEFQVLIEQLNLVLHPHDKIAIIGEEGNGKSTLLKAIVMACPYATIQGLIQTNGYRIGYLKQAMTEDELKQSPFAYLFSDETIFYQQSHLFYRILKQLQLREDLLEVPHISFLSGGEKVKLQLFKLFLEEADILLLDEPTNDLDLETLTWFENFLCQTEKPVLFVSHDEYLLRKVANGVLHLELVQKKTKPRHTLVHCRYDEYVQSRLHQLNKTVQLARKEKQQYQKQEQKMMQLKNKVAHQLNTVSPKEPHEGQVLKKKMKTIKAQEKRLNTTPQTEVPDYEEAICLRFDNLPIPNGKIVLDFSLDTLSIQGHVLARHLRFEVSGSQHIVIVGKNGVGKTTLLRHLYQTLRTRNDIVVGYMPQHYDELFQDCSSPVSFVSSKTDRETISKIRSLMGNLNFTKEEMTGSIQELSGGSKAKLILLKLLFDHCNVLILDEPTRNVSPLSNPVIRDALANFTGTIISVSHDRLYIQEVCDTVYELTENGLHNIRLSF